MIYFIIEKVFQQCLQISFILDRDIFFSYLIALHRFVYDYTNRSTAKKTDSILK